MTEKQPAKPSRWRRWIRRHELNVGVVILILLLLLAYFSPDIFYFVHPGQAAVRWSRLFGGTVLDKVYLEGIHVILPWDKFYIYNVRVQHKDVTVEVLSNDALHINVKVSVRYHPVVDSLAYLHQRVGPDYLDVILIPELNAAIRDVVAKYRPEELHGMNRSEIRDRLQEFMGKEAEERYVFVDDILIRSVTLPGSVRTSIESKLSAEQLALEYEYRIEAERKEAKRKAIEAQGIAAFQATVSGGISERYLKWKGIDATLALAKSANSKVVIVGGGEDGLPIILGPLDSGAPQVQLPVTQQGLPPTTQGVNPQAPDVVPTPSSSDQPPPASRP